MNDLDTELRAVARALVAGAPAPPPFPHNADNTLAPTRRRARAIPAVAAALVGIAAAVILVGSGDLTRIVASNGDEPRKEPATTSHRCDADPALRVTVPSATGGPAEGAAPGNPPLGAGQRALHWSTSQGAVELRWPGREQPIYDDGTAVLSTLTVGESVSAGRAEIDVSPAPNATDPTRRFDPDVVLEARAPAAPVPAPPCDLLELTVITTSGRWHSGLRPRESEGELGQPAEHVDLQPRIVERRSVEVAPRTAIRCQGSDQYGTPPNRTGGADRSIRGRQPAHVLLGYLDATPGAQRSGYVEMAEPDGSITYGVDPSGSGWTTLVFVARAGDEWYLEGWTASGC